MNRIQNFEKYGYVYAAVLAVILLSAIILINKPATTGFAVANESSDDKAKSKDINESVEPASKKTIEIPAINVSAVETGNNVTTNETKDKSKEEKQSEKKPEDKTIEIKLDYKSGTLYDSDDDGVETTTGIVDLSVENTKFGWDAKDENLCTRWEVYSIEDAASTILCYGGEKCCEFVNLLSSRPTWNEPFYASYGSYGATLLNIVSAQVLYVDYSLDPNEPFAEVYNSEWENSSVQFFSEYIDFKDTCIDTCLLSGFNESSYKLIFEINNSVLVLDTLTYTTVETIDKVRVDVDVKDSEGIASGSYSLYKNNDLVTGEYVEPDYYNIEIIPNEKIIDRLVVRLNISKPLTAKIGLDDVTRDISIDYVDIKKTFAASLEDLQFDEAELEATASANSLYRCKQWDFERELCFGSWEKVMDLAAGQQYKLSLAKEAAGFVEGNANITISNATDLIFVANIPNISIVKNGNATINLSQYFSNIGDKTTFTYYLQDNMSILFENDIATIIPGKDFVGRRITFIIGNQSDTVAVSNVFSINLTEENPALKRGKRGPNIFEDEDVQFSRDGIIFETPQGDYLETKIIPDLPTPHSHGYEISRRKLAQKFAFNATNNGIANQLKNKAVNVAYQLNFLHDISGEYLFDKINLKGNRFFFKKDFYCNVQTGSNQYNVKGNILNQNLLEGGESLVINISYSLPADIQKDSVITCYDPVQPNTDYVDGSATLIGTGSPETTLASLGTDIPAGTNAVLVFAYMNTSSASDSDTTFTLRRNGNLILTSAGASQIETTAVAETELWAGVYLDENAPASPLYELNATSTLSNAIIGEAKIAVLNGVTGYYNRSSRTPITVSTTVPTSLAMAKTNLPAGNHTIIAIVEYNMTGAAGRNIAAKGLQLRNVSGNTFSVLAQNEYIIELSSSGAADNSRVAVLTAYDTNAPANAQYNLTSVISGSLVVGTGTILVLDSNNMSIAYSNISNNLGITATNITSYTTDFPADGDSIVIATAQATSTTSNKFIPAGGLQIRQNNESSVNGTSSEFTLMVDVGVAGNFFGLVRKYGNISANPDYSLLSNISSTAHVTTMTGRLLAIRVKSPTADVTFPMVNTSFNISSPTAGQVINFTGNATDDIGLVAMNITYNLSGIITYLNFSLSGLPKFQQVSNVTTLPATAAVLNFTLYATDIGNNVKQNSTLISVTTVDQFPSLKISFNLSSIQQGNVINFSANATDDAGLLFINLTNNQSGSGQFMNYSVSGISYNVSNTTSITAAAGNVINFTAYATDSINQVTQLSQLFTVIESAAPVVNTTFNISSPLINNVINFTGNITDESGLLMANITWNISGIITYSNYTISGTSAQVSNATQLTSSGVFNFTMFATDTSNNVKQNSTLIIVPFGTFYVNISLPLNNSQVTVNTTFSLIANVTCKNADCGVVQGLARYNDSGSNISNKSISTVKFATPLFINGSGSGIKQYNFGGVTYPAAITSSNATYGYHTSTKPQFVNLTSETEFGGGGNTANNYTNISSLDEVYALSTGGSSRFVAHKFIFKINESESAVSKLTIFWNGTGGRSGGDLGGPDVNINLSIWDSNAWEVLGNCTKPNVNPITDSGCVINSTIITNIGNYINETDNNAVYILAISSFSGQGGPGGYTSAVKTNYIELNVTSTAQNPLSCGNMLQNDQCQLNWTINASGDVGSQLVVDVNFSSDNANVAANDTEDHLIIIVGAADTTFPIVNTSFNISSPLINNVINFTGNITDETGLLMANITWNISGIITYSNYTISGTSAQVSNATQLTSSGVFNFTMYATDTNNNVKQNSTLIIVPFGGLLINISLPLNNSQVVANTTFSLIANVTCKNADCGVVQGIARYNDSASNVSNKSISITFGATPLFVNGTGEVIKHYDFGGITYPSPVALSNATYGNHTSTKPDSINLSGESEFGSGGSLNINYSNISSLDDVFAKTRDNTAKFAAQKFTFKINESEDAISSLKILWNGTGGRGAEGDSQGVNVNVSIWNSNAWEAIGNCTKPSVDASSDTGCVINISITSNIANYINETDNNAVYILALSMFPGSFGRVSVVRTNYIELNATTTAANPLSCGNMLQNDQCQLNWTINASGDVGSQLVVDVNFSSDNANVVANDTEDHLITIVGAADTTPPIVNTTLNATTGADGYQFTSRNIDVLNFTGNVTDETALLSANWTVNFSSNKQFMNYTLSGTSAQASNTTDLRGLVNGSVLNFTLFATDTSNNVKQNSTLLIVTDALVPVVNTTLNATPRIKDVINITANITDETRIMTANITINFTTGTVYVNFTSTSASSQFSNSSQIPDNCVGGCVINYTVYATDTSNNVKQNSTVVTVIDNVFPIVNTTFNKTNPAVNDIINISGNITDETGLLSANITWNISGIITYSNYTLSGTSAQLSNSTALACTESCVINFTMYATDASANVKQNSTLLIINDLTAPVANTTFNSTIPRNIDIINFSGNITDGIGLLSANWTINYSNNKIYMNYTLSGTTAQVSNTTDLRGLVNGSVLNFTLYATDTSNNVKQNSTLLIVIDSLAPVVNTTFNISSPFINNVINFTGNITDESGLLMANITWNISGMITYSNYTLSGTSAQVSNATTLPSTPAVINFTMFATDTSNNVKQNSTLISVIDLIPRINASLDDALPFQFSRVNMTANVSDETGLAFCQFIDNQSLSNGAKTYFNTSVTGTSDQCSQNYTIRLAAGSVINFTVIVNDTNNNINASVNRSDSGTLHIGQIITVRSNAINNCTTLDAPNSVFNLTQDANSGETCFYIAANNVTLDCKGFEINYSQSAVGYGINISSQNYSTVKSCNIVQADLSSDTANSYGVYVFKNSSNNTFYNNTITTSGSNANGVHLTSTAYNNSVYSNTIATSGAGIGVYLLLTAYGNNVHNNNITITTSDSNGFGVSLNSNAYNNSVYGNTIITSGSTGYGVYLLSTAYNNSVYSNTIATSGGVGIGVYLDTTAYGNNIYSNNITTTGSNGNGVCLDTTAYGNNVYDNNITTSGSTGYGVCLDTTAYGNNIYSNNITTSGSNGFGVYLLSTAYNNSVYGNTIATSGSTGYGVRLASTTYGNNVYDNNITTSGGNGFGVYLQSTAYNNSVYGNTIATSGSTGYGVYLLSTAYNNSVYSNTITTSNLSSHGIYLNNNVFNNTIYGNNITTKNTSSSYSIYLERGVNNNSFYRNRISSLAAGIVINGSTPTDTEVTTFNSFTNDTIVPCTTGCASNYQDIVLTANATDITFINASFNKSRVAFSPLGLAAPREKNNMTVQWFLDVNVTNSSNNNPIANAQVVINDTNGLNIFNGTTDATGGIPTQLVTEFTMNGSVPWGNNDSCRQVLNTLITENLTCFTTYNISVNYTGYNNNNTKADVNSSKFLNLSMAIIADTTFPIVNTTLNATIASEGTSQFTARNIDVINFTGNITDETGLLSANWTVNFSNNKQFMNYTLSGTTAQVSNTTDLRGLVNGSVLNFTLYATDTSNNVKQNSTLLIVTDALVPVVNTTFNISSPFINNVINFTGNITDESGLKFVNVTYNLSGVITYANYTISGTSIQISNVTTLCSSACVLNFTMFATDTSSNVKQNSTLITVTNRAPIIKLNNVTGFAVDPVEAGNSIILLSFNVTDSDGAATINASKAIVNLTLGTNDGQFRFNISRPDSDSEFGTCINHTEPGPGSETARVVINCTVLLRYYENSSSNWVINISVKDISGSAAINDTLRFTYNVLSAISLPYQSINFSTVNLGQQNVKAYPHILMNNTGNDDFNRINMSAAALVGTTTASESIGVTNFGVNLTNSSTSENKYLAFSADGTVNLRNPLNGSNASLYHGHTSAFAPNNDKGNISAFIWVNVPSSGLSAQLYNATWNITAVS